MRLRLSQPTITAEDEKRNHKPFLSLCFKTTPEAYRLKDFAPRAQPCVVLRYQPDKKAYAVLSLPDMALSYSLELRFVPNSFPLRSTSPMARQLDALVQPTGDELTYASIHGPGNMLLRQLVS